MSDIPRSNFPLDQLVREHIDEADRNKGQDVFAAASSVGGLIASFLGGWLFTIAPVRFVLIVGAISSCCGTFLLIVALRMIAAKGE